MKLNKQRCSIIIYLLLCFTLIYLIKDVGKKQVASIPFVPREEYCVNEHTAEAELDRLYPQPEKVFITNCLVSHYCACKICCGKWADGKDYCGLPVVEGKTIAVDPKVIPLGSTVVVDGHEYIATDTGAFTGNHVDIYVADHERALHLGILYKTIYYIKEE